MIGDPHERVEFRFRDEEICLARNGWVRPPAIEHLDVAGRLGAAAADSVFALKPNVSLPPPSHCSISPP